MLGSKLIFFPLPCFVCSRWCWTAPSYPTGRDRQEAELTRTSRSSCCREPFPPPRLIRPISAFLSPAPPCLQSVPRLSGVPGPGLSTHNNDSVIDVLLGRKARCGTLLSLSLSLSLTQIRPARYVRYLWTNSDEYYGIFIVLQTICRGRSPEALALLVWSANWKQQPLPTENRPIFSLCKFSSIFANLHRYSYRKVGRKISWAHSTCKWSVESGR